MAKLSSDKSYVIVEKGDTLSQIAADYRQYSNGATYQTLAKNNDIDNPNLIYVGQKIILKGSVTKSSNTTSKATIKQFGLQTKTDRTVFATWAWDKTNTENYQVKWEYDSGNGIWFMGENSTVDIKQSLYNAPSNAKRVRFTVKPISKKRKVNNKETSYWTAGWSTTKTYSFSDNPPEVPAVPTVTLDGLKLKAELNNISGNASIIQFALYKDDIKSNTGKAAVKAAHAAYEFKLTAGSVYKVQCRTYYDGDYSEWSDFSTPTGTIPAKPEKFTKCILQGDENDRLYLEWKGCKAATSYEIEYTTDKSLFDAADSNLSKITVSSETEPNNPPTKTTITSLEKGAEYFLRIRAKNEKGVSEWSEISSTKIGDAPAAPTTWSSNNSVILGEPIVLYWVHNAKDGASQVEAEIDIVVNANGQITDSEDNFHWKNTTDEEDKDKTSSHTFPTSIIRNYRVEAINDRYVQTNEVVDVVGNDDTGMLTDTGNKVLSGTVDGQTVYYCMTTDLCLVIKDQENKIVETIPIAEGAEIDWRIKTLGEGSDQYSEFSVMRKIHVYAPPTVTMSITDANGDDIDTLDDGPIITKFPFTLDAHTGPVSQSPIGYYISIVTQESYTTVDAVGNDKNVVKGDVIYSKYIPVDTGSDNPNYALSHTFGPGEIDLENNITYKVTVMANMNSGLNAEESIEFTVGWEDTAVMYEPNAEIMFDEETYTANIRPYCEDTSGNLIDNITLSLYRREFDGSFTEIATGLANTDNAFVTDPHPSLDFARYRVVAITNDTGSVIYCDIPGYPVNCTEAIIQWDETWSGFDTGGNSDVIVEPSHTGSILKILYNIDVSEKNKPDVELIEYIGRKHAVSYYGTQLGESQTWNFVIPAYDKDTLYLIRRLKSWMGDVYVREPSGTGYWAHVEVSISQKHCEVTIPISISITRVEGGI